MFGRRSTHSGELIIPPLAEQSSSGKEIVRGWVVDGGLHVSLELVWDQPAAWGVALADITRHLADAYQSAKGVEKEETIKQILGLLHAELDSPTDTPTGSIVD